jgi:hypothetical protein
VLSGYLVALLRKPKAKLPEFSSANLASLHKSIHGLLTVDARNVAHQQPFWEWQELLAAGANGSESPINRSQNTLQSL